MKYIISLLLITSTCTLAQSWGDWADDQWLNIDLVQKLHRLDDSSLYASWEGTWQIEDSQPLKALSELEQWDFDLWVLTLEVEDVLPTPSLEPEPPMIQEPIDPTPVQPPVIPGASVQERLLVLNSV